MSTLSQVYGDHPLHLRHIIPLDFDSVQMLPDSHIWPKLDDIFESSDDGLLMIPSINLTNPEAQKLITHACETWGVFQVTDHGVPLNLLDEVEFQARRLFSLPARQKLKALRSSGGATGYGIARLSEFFNTCMWHEGFTIIGSRIDHVRELWPHDYRRFCGVMEDYQTKMKELATKLIGLIIKNMGISAEEVKGVLYNIGSPSSALQLNSYPFCPDRDRAMGLAPHTDTSLLTILHQSSACGLQTLKEGVGWVLVRPTRGALVVNIGDFLHIISNARFPSVLHRVIMKKPRHWLSVAYFYCPPTDFNLTPLVFSSDDEQVPQYRDVSVAEYIGIKARNLGKALSFIKL
ncbi:hypothetical protein K2173_026022 [Erythroxylum novogranatense]|uniref:gibberellin 3beta-dioxygenase n=1 Tax=Erythroxylum novogranatense TaxID=1862640 RepID=A0AAV8SI27_9ROSI|nr:hypothetical protein K2173_026022 [Erythroxylum novogranatense]